MIVAGIGCRKNVDVADVIAAIEMALKTHGLAMTELSTLATTAFKRNEEAIFAAGRELGLPVIVVEDRLFSPTGRRWPEEPDEGAVVVKTLSHSDLSLSLAGTPSVSESAALAAAGDDARLLGSRIVVGPVTCAIAISGDRP